MHEEFNSVCRFNSSHTTVMSDLGQVMCAHVVVVVVVVVEIFVHGTAKATVTNAPQSRLNK